MALLARRFGLGVPAPTMGSKGKRVVVLEVTTLDPKRRLVLIRRDDQEHLLLLGISGEQVVEANIESQQSSFKETLNSLEQTHEQHPREVKKI